MSTSKQPILISLTGHTCSGKNYIFEKVIEKFGFNKVVSTTSRPIRKNEVEGSDYYFVNKELMGNLLATGQFEESVTHGDYMYGVTVDEFKNKVTNETPAVIILTPEGVKQYEDLCACRKVLMLKFFVKTPLEVRKERLIQRTVNELNSVSAIESRVIGALIDRCIQMQSTETFWRPAHDSIILDGTDSEWAIETIKFYVQNAQRKRLHVQ